jgi:rRNA maturation endonuclease Nob1
MERTPVSQLHSDKLKEISALEEKLPALKEQLRAITDIIDELDIVDKRNCEIQIRKLKEEIAEIEGLKLKYFKDCGYLLNRYLETPKMKHPVKSSLDVLGKKVFSAETNQKKHFYRTYRTLVDPEFTSIDEDTVNEENYCFNCNAFRVTFSEEAIMACQKCGSQSTVTQRYTKPSVEDPPTENKVYEYQRFTHLCNWIDNVQGKEPNPIPEHIINLIKKEIQREKKDLDALTESDIRRYLKKYKTSNNTYYKHSTKILWIVTGIQPLQMTQEMEANLQNMFMAIQEPFERYKNARHNFSSYAYILYKFCQLLGYDEFLPKFKLHKNESLIYQHDQIWKKICLHMGGPEKGWTFFKTYTY